MRNKIHLLFMLFLFLLVGCNQEEHVEVSEFNISTESSISSSYNNFSSSTVSSDELQETSATIDSSQETLNRVESNFVLTIDDSDEDYIRMIASLSDSSAYFAYYTEISDHAEEYLSASGIKEGTLVYENDYKYILRGDDLLESEYDLDYLFNPTDRTEEEVIKEINQILVDNQITLSNLKIAMQEKYNAEK